MINDNVTYDKFGAKISQQYGNGITTNYDYDEFSRRLMEIATSNGSQILYNYDPVGNVTDVSSNYPWRAGFNESFYYDSADQLVDAYGNDYYLGIEYDTIKKWGQINRYYNDIYTNGTYTNNYFYYHTNINATQTSFAPELQDGTEDIEYTYGINGSLRKREVHAPDNYIDYYLFNSQGNMKAYSTDGIQFAYYGYDAANTRTYKISMFNSNSWVNGKQQPLHLQLQLQQAMFYPNAYLNFDNNGNYTKHYYNGTERIVSRLGTENIVIANDDEDFEERRNHLRSHFNDDIQELLYAEENIDTLPEITISYFQPTGPPEDDIFYYHTNHLGSTAFVTDNNSSITQGFVYAPFGEIVEEYNATFGNDVIPKYSFNAKELDEETGMYYFEARYYRAPTFTSRDPLMNEKSWFTPYHYCSNNPLKHVDPSGKDGLVVVNDENKSLTVKATYFVQSKRNDKMTYTAEEIKTMQKDINEFLNGQGYNVTEGQYAGYSVNFDLQFKEGGESFEAISFAEEEIISGISIGNDFSKGDKKTHPKYFTPNEKGDVIGGITTSEKSILMNSSHDNLRNKIHEIFHTLFFDNDNAPNGIGAYNNLGMPNQNDINLLINNSRLPKIKP